MLPRLIVIALLVLAASPAEAQVDPFHTVRGKWLEPSDLALLGAAAEHLLDAQVPAIGAVEKWSNAETGAAGSVAYLGPTTSVVQGKRQACRKLHYEASVKGRPEERRINLEWCRQPDGNWMSR